MFQIQQKVIERGEMVNQEDEIEPTIFVQVFLVLFSLVIYILSHLYAWEIQNWRLTCSLFVHV